MTRPVPISVIVPTYNDAAFLPRSVSSAARQMTAEDELIVVDDGSLDNTREVFEDLAVSFSDCYLRYVFQANKGVSGARNTGMQEATNPYLVFLDADDELLPQALSCYRNKPGVDLFIGGHEWSRGSRIRSRLPQISGDPLEDFRQILAKQIHIGNLSCMCVARDAALAVGFEESLPVSEDMAFLLVILARGKVEAVQAHVARVHRRETSLRNSLDTADLLQLGMIETLFAHPLLPAEYQQFRDVAEARRLRAILRAAWQERDYSLYVTAFAEFRARYPDQVGWKWRARLPVARWRA